MLTYNVFLSHSLSVFFYILVAIASVIYTLRSFLEVLNVVIINEHFKRSENIISDDNYDYGVTFSDR